VTWRSSNIFPSRRVLDKSETVSGHFSDKFAEWRRKAMERPQIKHIAIAVPDEKREKLAEYYKSVFRMEEKDRSPNGGIYLSDGHICLALINTRTQTPGLNHFGFLVGSIPEIEEAAHSTAQDNVPGARAEKWIRDPEGNRVDISEDGWPI
jgi:hypothetical protein